MKPTTIMMGFAIAAGALGFGGGAMAQERHDDRMRHSEIRHVHVRHVERRGHGWGHDRQHCRIVWRHHHRIRQCW